MARDPEALRRYEQRTLWPLAGVALLFLGAWAWPIVDPTLGRGWRTACATTLVVVWVAFAVDYATRLRLAPDRRAWARAHVLDLIALLAPVLRPLQLIRLVSLLQVLNRTAAASLRGKVGAYVVLGATLLAMIASLAILSVERGRPGAQIETFGDALWWACTTMTTVGYGDLYPVTTSGRFIAVGLMLSGIALLGAVSAMVASTFIQAVADETDSDIDRLQAEVARLTAAVERLAERRDDPSR